MKLICAVRSRGSGYLSLGRGRGTVIVTREGTRGDSGDRTGFVHVSFLNLGTANSTLTVLLTVFDCDNSSCCILTTYALLFMSKPTHSLKILRVRDKAWSILKNINVSGLQFCVAFEREPVSCGQKPDQYK